ncbi:MarR family transcriptional regulator [Actinoplanes sp. LDG1-06]|uniref:MarR family transcriptional regulator n=1 Tax=Paractinoplanes ovalisporus TaxID=2810368 RepID=A0ABS2AWJ7_9ACTN|nr:MarR family transcriptional regulator [Actinoplanes ovalisporus]MBM2623586.1 MarR family transcriptional regulator [Actinoplanes ovalisporus]
MAQRQTKRQGPVADRKAEIVQLLIQLGDRARRVVSSTIQEFGAPESVAEALRVLGTSETPLTLRDLASRLGRDPSTVSLAADKLEHADLVVRVPHPTDGRKRVLQLTERGNVLWGTLQHRLHESNVFNDLDAAELKTLLELLRRG